MTVELLKQNAINGIGNSVHSTTLKMSVTNGHVDKSASSSLSTTIRSGSFLKTFLTAQAEIEAHKNGKPVVVDGYTLSVAGVSAAARYGAQVQLDKSPEVRSRVDKSRQAIDEKLSANKSIYGLSTGFGGSADTRTNRHLTLGNALLQHQHIGILPSSANHPNVLPLGDPLASTSMPEAWVRAAVLVRTNSLIRGHSAVRWELLEQMTSLLQENIMPVVPLRGSISASGDLSPLSYVAATIIGNPAVRVFSGPKPTWGPREMMSARKALQTHNIKPLELLSKEHLGLVNGTAFAAAVSALSLNDAVHLAMLTQVCTAMGTEALLGTRASHAPFIHNIARPHVGQVETAKHITDLLDGSKLAAPAEEVEVTTEEDKGELRQDRYPLRTAPQFIGPQLEDILHAFAAVTQECNSTTDNPLVDGENGTVHHGGNFQAMAVTNAMEKTRLAIHHLGKILFAQSTELLNPAFNRGLPPSMAGTDPSVNYHCKGLDIATAAYVSELGYLANPVSTHIQSAEMHNQSVNSLALISARATVTSLDVLTMIIASYLYVLCQALDLRALQDQFHTGIVGIAGEELKKHFGDHLSAEEITSLQRTLAAAILSTLETTSTMDAIPRLKAVAASTSTPLVDFFSAKSDVPSSVYSAITLFRSQVASRSSTLLEQLRYEFISGEKGLTPASPYLGKTRAMYEFVRSKLGVKMHGMENFTLFEEGINETEMTIGQNISLIYESIRDGQMQSIVVSMFQ